MFRHKTTSNPSDDKKWNVNNTKDIHVHYAIEIESIFRYYEPTQFLLGMPIPTFINL